MAQTYNGKTEPEFTGSDFEKALIVYLNENDFFWFINKVAGQFVPLYDNYKNFPERSRQILLSDKIYDDGERTLRPYFIAYNKALSCYCLYYMTANQKRGERYTGGFLEVPQSVYASTFSCIGGVRKDNHYHDELSYPAIDYSVCVPVPIDLLNIIRLRAPYGGLDSKGTVFLRQLLIHPEREQPTKRVFFGGNPVWFKQREDGMHIGDKAINPSVCYLAIVQNYLVSLAGKTVPDMSIKTEKYYRGAEKLLTLVSDELVRFCSNPQEDRNKSVDKRVIKAAANWLGEFRVNISCTPTNTKLLSCLSGKTENDRKMLTEFITEANANFARKAERARHKAEEFKKTALSKAKTRQEKERIREMQRVEDEKNKKEAEMATKKVIKRAVVLFNELYYDASAPEDRAASGLNSKVKQFSEMIRSEDKSIKDYRKRIAGGKSVDSLLAIGKYQGSIAVADMRNSFGSDAAFVNALNVMAQKVGANNTITISDDNGKATEELFNIISKLKPLTKTSDELVQRVYDELGTKRTKLTPEIVRDIDLGGTNTARAKMDEELGRKAMLETATGVMNKEVFYSELKMFIDAFARQLPVTKDSGGEFVTDMFTARDNVINNYNSLFEVFFKAGQYNAFETGADIKQKAIKQALQIAKDGVRNKENYTSVLNKVKNYLMGVAGSVRADVENVSGYVCKIEQIDAKCAKYFNRFNVVMAALSVFKQHNGSMDEEGLSRDFDIKDYLSLPLEKKVPYMDQLTENEKTGVIDAVNWFSGILKDIADRSVPFSELCYTPSFSSDKDFMDLAIEDKVVASAEVFELYYILSAINNAFRSPDDIIEGGIDKAYESGKKAKANVPVFLSGVEKQLEELDAVYRSVKSIVNRSGVAMDVKSKINKLYEVFNRTFKEPKSAEMVKFTLDLFKYPLSEADFSNFNIGKLRLDGDWFGAARCGIDNYINGFFMTKFAGALSPFILQRNSEGEIDQKECDRIRKITQSGTRFYVNVKDDDEADGKRGKGDGDYEDLGKYAGEFAASIDYLRKISELVYNVAKGDKKAEDKLLRILDKTVPAKEFKGIPNSYVVDDVFHRRGGIDTDDANTRAGLNRLLLAFLSGGGEGVSCSCESGLLDLICISKSYGTTNESGAKIFIPDAFEDTGSSGS